MHASVVIPTHNREQLLNRIIACYALQDCGKEEFELVIVDDGSEDKTHMLFDGLDDISGDGAGPGAARYGSIIEIAKSGWFQPMHVQAGVFIRYIKIRKAGRSTARNVGILFAASPLIIFADDDIFAEPGFIRKHAANHDTDDTHVIMGRVIHTADPDNPFSARWKPKDINRAFLATGNASVLKRHLIEAGLFDEWYTVYGWEDFDLGVHLQEHGLKSVQKKIYGYHYDPSLKRGHKQQPLGLYEKERERGLSAVYFYHNHPLPWVRRFTLVENSWLKTLSNLLGRNNWFLQKETVPLCPGLFRLIVRYKGYFDGVAQGLQAEQAGNKDLLVFSNGPGEVSTWVKPFVEAVKKRPELASSYRVILIMLPCQFGSGTEYRVGRTIEGIEHIIQKREFMRMLITGLGRKKYTFSREGIICSLGGNLMYPVLFRKRVRGRHGLYAYSHNQGWEKAYTTIFVRNSYVKEKYLRRGVAEEKLLVTGDLVYSSLKYLRERSDVRRELGIQKNEKMIAFLPGSREYMTKHIIPIFLKLIDDVCDRVNGIRPYLLKSPYVSFELIAESLNVKEEIKGLKASTGTLHNGSGMHYIDLDSGKRVYILDGQLDYWGRGIDFAVTIPGTNTVQLAYRGIPALIVAPGNKPEVVPIEGAANFVKYIPFFGKYLLQKVILAYADSFPHIALPNIYMNEEILPEMVGILHTDDITRKIQDLLEDDALSAIREKLACFQFDTNPVETILNTIWPPA
jgi:lipid-A-disaccharide synthase